MLDQFQRFGCDLFNRGLTSSHGGNMSVRMGDRIIITRTGSMLAHLTEKDLIEIGLDKDDSNIMLASSELVLSFKFDSLFSSSDRVDCRSDTSTLF